MNYSKSLRPWAAVGLLWCVVGAWAQTKGAATAQSIATLKKQAASGDADAQMKLGSAYYFGRGIQQDYVEAAAWYRKVAEQGYANAQYIGAVRTGAAYGFG